MFDMHYDLLSRLYYDYYKYGCVRNCTKDDLKKIYSNDNIVGGVIDLYFMNPDEMYEEIGIKEDEIDVLSMFKISTSLLEDLKKEGIFSKDIKFVYSIEGCDYIKSIDDLDELYSFGLRAILLVWNNKNKYGSGNKSDIGLTDLGRKFIKHAVELGIIIDVSHANKNTFYDIIDVLKECSNYNLIASHSNAYDICSNMRNLDKEQLVTLKNMGGYIGIVGYNKFVGEDNYKQMYLKHINYLIDDIGFDTDKIILSTDNMYFINCYDSTFDLYNISSEVRYLLSSKYSDDIVDAIMYKNARMLLKDIN